MTEPMHGRGATGPGSVVLDLGDAVGALVLETPASLHGHEIEISQVGRAGGGRTHSLVRERETAAGIRYAAVYPGLAVGRYLIWRYMGTPVGEVTIDGGMVTRFRWPD